MPNCTQTRMQLTNRSKVFVVKPGQSRTRFRTCHLMDDPMSGTKRDTTRKYRERGEKSAPRNRSSSPDREAQRTKDSMDPAEVINALAASDEGYRIAVSRFSGPGVRAKIDDRYKTRKDYELQFKDEAVGRALRSLHMLNSDELQQKLRAARKRELALDPTFGGPDKEFGEELKGTKPEDLVGAGIDTGLDCSVCGDNTEDIAFKCLHCITFVFCNSCFMCRRDAHPKDDKHQFELIKSSDAWDRAADGVMDDTKKAPEVPHEQATFCKCETTSKEYLISCDGDDCQTLFHPGCYDRGLFHSSMYKQNAEYFNRKDYNAHKNGRSWKCEACNDDAPVESEQSRQRSARVIARANARAAEAQSKATKKVYNAQEEAAKEAELKMAETQQEKAAIEAKWEEIADDEMDPAEDDPLAGIQTFPMGLIAFHFKPQ